jgi:hypothetical protein
LRVNARRGSFSCPYPLTARACSGS